MTESSVANTAQHEFWNTVAGPRWVLLGGLVERRVRAVNDLLLARSEVAAGESVLEIGCGTGAATVPFAQAVGEHGRVVGVDISEPMLAGARKRIAESGLGNVSLIEADAQFHPFEPDRFDLITSRFGVMFFADPVAAFRNVLPAARPGGRLCFACWAPLEENKHWLIPYEVALRRLGPPAPSDPRAPGPLALSDPGYGLRALDPRDGRICRGRDRPRDARDHRVDARGGSGLRLRDGASRPTDRREETQRSRAGDDPAGDGRNIRGLRPEQRNAASVDGVSGNRAPPALIAGGAPTALPEYRARGIGERLLQA